MRNSNHTNSNSNQVDALRRCLESLRALPQNNATNNEEEYFPRAFARPRCPVRCGYPLYTSNPNCSN